jgi:hypothetical protein
MSNTKRSQSAGFAKALLCDAPSEELGDRAKDFDWVIGGWSAIVRDYGDDGSISETTGEWWFSWVLEGRAIQDVWIVPARVDRTTFTGEFNRYGTTIRYFDPVEQIWRVVWINPVNSVKSELAGRRQGDRIELEGTAGAERIRWSFNEISADAFVWRGEHRGADKRWLTGAEFFLKRK